MSPTKRPFYVLGDWRRWMRRTPQAYCSNASKFEVLGKFSLFFCMGGFDMFFFVVFGVCFSF